MPRGRDHFLILLPLHNYRVGTGPTWLSFPRGWLAIPDRRGLHSAPIHPPLTPIRQIRFLPASIPVSRTRSCLFSFPLTLLSTPLPPTCSPACLPARSSNDPAPGIHSRTARGTSGQPNKPSPPRDPFILRFPSPYNPTNLPSEHLHHRYRSPAIPRGLPSQPLLVQNPQRQESHPPT
ncbi:hypothetical protein B0J18DRAFT_118105 [Chaetomium sp. MPI-SDFR-AT-0129]|nr:hypothetical protein B0J18DRAFT_118105 [Chaetomium sp. MPI-SDFR-AT-0129]